MANKWAAKLAVLSVFQPNSDPSRLCALSRLNEKQLREILLWLDQSGLALYFLHRLQEIGATQQIWAELRHELEERLARNVERTHDMLEEFNRLNAAFREFGVQAAALKGFTLVPEYCPESRLRHQTDFDFLVAPGAVEAAADALANCGYSTDTLRKDGESCFTTPLNHIPSYRDDLYCAQRQRQVDLHTAIWEELDWISPEFPADSMNNLRRKTVLGASFHSLSPEDQFLVQVFHAFRHSFRSWIRASWLLEISNFLEIHRNDDEFWGRVVTRAGNSTDARRVVAFVLGLTSQLFRKSSPQPLLSWAARALPPSTQTWIEHFSVRWILSDWPGSLLNILMAADFMRDSRLRSDYLKSRLVPEKRQLSIGTVNSQDSRITALARKARWQYLAHRSIHHLRNLLSLMAGQIRWKLVLHTPRSRAAGGGF